MAKQLSRIRAQNRRINADRKKTGAEKRAALDANARRSNEIVKRTKDILREIREAEERENE